MVESVAKVFSALASLTDTARVWKELVRGKRGDKRALLEEIKENLGLCWLVVGEGTEPERVLGELRTEEYDRLARAGFNFNALKRGPVAPTPELEASDLAPLLGKDTAALLENIYDKVKELRRLHRVDPDNPRVDRRRRVLNLHKRLLLLTEHLRGEG